MQLSINLMILRALFFITIAPILIIFLPIYVFSYETQNTERLEVLAYWTDSQHMAVQVPNNVLPRNSLSFFIRDPSSLSTFSIELPALSYNNDWIILNTSQIPVHEQKRIIRTALVLDVMSGTFLMQRTGIALTTILDDLFYTDTELGQIWNPETVELRLWSPTAEKVLLHLFNSANSKTAIEIFPMTQNNGVWSLKLPSQYKSYYYLFEIKNYFPELQNFQTVFVTDPYSFGLAADGKKSLLVDLNSAETKPSNWDNYILPDPVKNINSVIYENHIRDLTANDKHLPHDLKGKYLGLATETSQAYRHLKDLKKSGITHLHLLPFNDFATVPEITIDQETLPNVDWSSPDEAPTALGRIRLKDNYNWGYDPVHWLTPEGSYSTQADGVSRIIEIRKMIQSVHRLNLHISQDVVFNHTYASDFLDKSVLNKIVPSYYYRLGHKGFIESSSCCADTATENRMMEKLMIDSLKHWIKFYHITSFRFDLMSFHSRETMIRARDTIKNELKKYFNIPADSVLIFGEAWAFGSYYDRHPDQAMTQINSYGADIGTFNDRLRDALRGGTTNLSEPSDQGFITGLNDHFNHSPRNKNTPTTSHERLEKFLHLKDIVKIGLAGNLKEFKFKEHWGSEQFAGNIYFRGSPAAYSHNPVETINYVSAHDGTTLWDSIQAKLAHQSEWAAPSTAPLWERVRRHQLALSLVLFSQGIPFIEGGTEILKSKNGDVDSYDSGDYYNALNLDLTSNNWSRALPPLWKNQSEWSFWAPKITDPTIMPTASDIQQTYSVFKTLLKLRKSSSLFKLGSLEQIQKNLTFIDGHDPADSSILSMQMRENDQNKILIIWNTSRSEKLWSHPILLNSNWSLHPEFNSTTIPWLNGIEIKNISIKLPALSFVVLVPGIRP